MMHVHSVQQVYDTRMNAVLAARYGTDEPAHLGPHELYVCIDGGKERRRLFTKSFPSLKAKDADRTVVRTITAFFTENTVRERRGRNRGLVKLTQQIHVAKSVKKLIPSRQFETYGGSTQGDVIGPIALDLTSSLPSMAHADKKEFYGKRRVLTGGHDGRQ